MAIVETAAHGATLEMGDGATVEQFSAVEGITSGPNGAGWASRTIEIFTHSSNVIKKKVTAIDPTDISFELAYDSSDPTHAAIRDAAKNKTLVNWKLTYADAGAESLTFAGIVSQFDRSADPEDWNRISVTITPFGDFTIN